jgi:integrase
MNSFNSVNFSMHLFKRENGIWYISFRRGIWKSLKTKDEKKARSLYNKIERKYLQGRVAVLENKPRISVSAFFEEYDKWCEENHSHTSYSREKRIFRKFESFIQGTSALHGITQKDGEAYISYCKKLGNKEVSINIELRTLKAAFKKACPWGYLKESPFRFIPLLKYHKELPRFIEKADMIDKIFEAIASEGKEITKRIYRLVFALYIYTGGRRSEIWKLNWKDITEDSITFRERKNYEMLTVPIVPRLKAILYEYERGVGRLIPVTIDQMSKRIKYYLRKAGVGHLKPHDLRHTFASHLLMSGVSLQTVQKLLGHVSIQATQIYTHLTEEHKKREILKLPYGKC